MKKIKLGFVVNNLLIGGVSKVLIKLCNKLDPTTYDIHLLILSDELEMESIIPLRSNINKHVFCYQFDTSYRLLSYLKNSFYIKATSSKAKHILKKISELDLDILHFHTLPRQLTIGVIAKKENPKLQLVFTDHSLRIAEGQYKWYQRHALAFAYRKLYKNYYIIAISKVVIDYIKKYSLGNKKYKVALLENSIDIEEYTRIKSISDIENQFVYISRLTDEKGQDTLIKAWLRLESKNKGKLILIGPDETDGRIYELANGDDSIVFTGSISDINSYLNNSTIGVFPSQKEGLPLALLEMMAYELPIIVSDIDELTSIVDNDKEGLHFKLDDVDDLVQKMTFLLNNSELAIKMGKKARAKAKRIGEMNKPIQFHNDFYKSILQHND